jgi:iron complex outermembrane receptor protein
MDKGSSHHQPDHSLNKMIMSKVKIVTLSFAGLCLNLLSFGQEQDSSDQRPHTLPPVEIRALRATENAPFAKTELSKKEIEKQNLGQDLPYLLQYTPSAVVTSDAGAGIGYTGLRIRGTDGTRINVTMNGVPVNDAESQGTFFVNFPDIASSTNSIQIQRGVGTSTNGAGAFGATISVSNLEQMKEAGVEINNSAGSFNTWKNTVKAGTGLLENGLQFDVRLSRMSSDGFRDRSASLLKAMQLITGWKASEQTSVRFMLMTGNEKTGQAWNAVPQAQLKGNDTDLYRHYQHNQGALYFTPQDSINLFHSDPRTNNYFTYSNQTDNYQQDYYQLFLDHHFNESLSAHIAGFLTRGKGYYEEYKSQEQFNNYGLESFISPSKTDTLSSTDLIRQLWLDNYFYGTVFSLLYEKPKTSLSIGGGFTQYDGEHYGLIKWAEYGVPNDYRWYLLDAQKTDLNLYVKGQHKVGSKLLLFADMQYRNIGYTINGFRKNPALRPSATYNFFNPKAGITYLLTDNMAKKQKLYASVAVANREPNRDDFEASPVNLPRPERLYDIEAGYELRRLNWHVGANYYYMLYKDQLILTGRINDVGAYTRTNVPESYRTGIEVQAAATPAKWVQLRANASFSSNKIRNFTEFVDNWDVGNQDSLAHGTTDIAYSPNLVAAGSVILVPLANTAAGKALEIELLEKYVGKQYLDNTSNENRVIKPYYTTDVRIRYSLKLKPFREVGILIGLNNVLNKLYENNGYSYTYSYQGREFTDNYYYPQAGFNWMAGLNLKW